MTAPLPALKDVQFGFELEGYVLFDPKPYIGFCGAIPARKRYAKQLRDLSGLPVDYKDHRKSWRTNSWVVVADGSVAVDLANTSKASIEIKSPILLPDVLPELPVWLAQIGQTDLQTDDRCGLHVHIGRPGQHHTREDNHLAWKPAEIVRFMDCFQQNADRIHALVDDSRPGNPHCKANLWTPSTRERQLWAREPATHAEHREMLVDVAKSYCPLELDDGIELAGENTGSRRFAVNLTSLIGKGTIEVKLRQADDFEQATPFIGLMLHLAQAAIDNRKFVWNDYVASVADDPALALPVSVPATPSRPRQHRQYAPAAAVR